MMPQANNNATVNNPYFANDGTAKYNSEVGADAVPFTDDSFQFVKICLPLKGSGIFRNPKIFPLMLTQGLRIEILLEEARKCINQLAQASQFAYAPNDRYDQKKVRHYHKIVDEKDLHGHLHY
eukprot:COSAG06_NODE_31084_length_527_cov_0.929907_1_plen_122_part_01